MDSYYLTADIQSFHLGWKFRKWTVGHTHTKEKTVSSDLNNTEPWENWPVRIIVLKNFFKN